MEVELSALLPLLERYNGMTVGGATVGGTTVGPQAKAPIAPAPEGPASLDDLLDLLPKREPADERRSA